MTSKYKTMEVIEITILAIGVILVAVTYILSEKFELGGKSVNEEVSNNTKRIAEELVKKEVDRELANVIDQKIEKTAIELDKIVNEKILAVGNYSDDILKKIENNHNEVMFLYNMLNEKEATLKDTIRDIEALKLSIKKMALVNDMSVAVAKKAEQAAAKKRAEKADISEKQEKRETEEAELQQNTEKRVELENDNIRRNRELSGDAGNKNEEILKMHKAGSTNMEIAKKLGIGIGEVRLVIDLFKK